MFVIWGRERERGEIGLSARPPALRCIEVSLFPVGLLSSINTHHLRCLVWPAVRGKIPPL